VAALPAQLFGVALAASPWAALPTGGCPVDCGNQSLPCTCYPPRSWSVAVNAASITQTSATININPPSEGGPFDRFVLSACAKPTSDTPNWDASPQTTCLPAQAAACPISGLAASSDYTVSAMAYAGNTTTIRSAADDFSTLPWP